MKEPEGVVIKVYGAFYTVLCEKEEYVCTLRGKIRKDKLSKRFSNPVAVGDRVLLNFSNKSGVAIEKVLTRENIFSRKDKGKNRKEDIIASNLDMVVVIQSYKTPEINLRFVDRILVRCVKEDIRAIVCINKMDLADKEQIKMVKEYYRNANVELLSICAITGVGLNNLKKILQGKVTLLVGNSGVGKTTILNKMYPGMDLRVSDVSGKTGKGKHTTSNVNMIIKKMETCIIDSPGLREFGLVDIEPNNLGNYFHEFIEYREKCGYRPCTHDHEPNCIVKEKVETGKISHERYHSYINILYSLYEHYKSLY